MDFEFAFALSPSGGLCSLVIFEDEGVHEAPPQLAGAEQSRVAPARGGLTGNTAPSRAEDQRKRSVEVQEADGVYNV